jgi:peptide subunit release factor RF-3
MRKIAFILALLIPVFIACEKSVFKKPKNLVNEKQMIDMLADIHLAEATFNHMRYDSIVRNSSSANFYYSVLAKYEVADSVFEKSFVYYASNPRNFEKMYREVMNKLSETEQGFSGRKNEILEFEAPK